MFKCLRYILVSVFVLIGALKASAQLSMPDTVCLGATKHYSVNDPSVLSTYTWTVDGVVQTTTTNEIIITWTIPGHHILTVLEHGEGGCDGDLRSGDVYVFEPKVVTKDTTVCSSALPFTWNNISITGVGDYPYVTTSSAGCDSTITLHVSVMNTVTASKDTTVCSNAVPFTWNGISITAAGDYPYTTKSAAGCDSTITLHVSVVNTVTANRDTTVCSNAVPFTWNGISITAAGDYPYTTKSSAGCDSTITLHVAVVNVINVTKDTTVCSNAVPFTWNGISVTAAGDYPYTTKSSAGCDSTITLHVSVVNTVTANKDTTVCSNAVPFTWNGISITAAGDYPYTTKSSAGCDSTITLHVSVVNTVTANRDTTVCSNAVPFIWNGISITAAGDYPYTTKSSAGCDSTITLHVAVVNVINVTKDTTVCSNAVPFTWNGISITAAGDYPYTTKSSAGCDSTITLHVSVVNTVTANKDTTVCSNAVPFTWNGISVTAAGDYPYTTKSAAGCDSTITLHVSVVNTVTASKDTTVCSNAVPFTWNGISVTAAGDYPYTTKSSAGCDSTITLHVAVVNVINVTKDTTVCSNAVPFTWNGISITAAGDYPYTTKSSAGCDSTITLHVSVVNTVTANKDTTVCSNAVPFTWNGISVTAAGDYPYLTKSSAGCDSTITLHVSVVNTVTASKDTTVCSNAVPFTWNGISITAAGDYPYTTKSAAGCDSTITLHVAVVNVINVTKDTTVCSNAVPFTWNGISVTAAG